MLGFAFVSEDTDLSYYKLEDFEKTEKEHGLYFERLILNTDSECMDLNQHGGRRKVYLSSNE